MINTLTDFEKEISDAKVEGANRVVVTKTDHCYILSFEFFTTRTGGSRGYFTRGRSMYATPVREVIKTLEIPLDVELPSKLSPGANPI